METTPGDAGASAVDGAPVAPAQPGPGSIEAFQFRGTGGEYFRIWIVNLLLSIVTIGIYSAWAKVRRLRYFYGSTWLAGSAFEYHGQPKQILRGRLIAVALLIAYQFATQIWPMSVFVLLPILFFAVPWLVVKSRLFLSRMSSYRNIRFDFRGTYGDAAIVFLLLSLLIPLTLGLILPYWLYRRDRLLVNNTTYGQTAWRLAVGASTFYKIALLTLLLAVPFIGIMALGAYLIGPGGLAGAGRSPQAVLGFAVMIIGYVGLLAVPNSYYWVSKQNAVLGNIRIAGHELRSNMRVGRFLGIALTNLILIVLTLGIFTPFAQIRLARYRLESLSLAVHGSLDEFVAGESNTVSATGEEVSDFFDVDFGF